MGMGFAPLYLPYVPVIHIGQVSKIAQAEALLLPYLPEPLPEVLDNLLFLPVIHFRKVNESQEKIVLLRQHKCSFFRTLRVIKALIY